MCLSGDGGVAEVARLCGVRFFDLDLGRLRELGHGSVDLPLMFGASQLISFLLLVLRTSELIILSVMFGSLVILPMVFRTLAILLPMVFRASSLLIHLPVMFRTHALMILLPLFMFGSVMHVLVVFPFTVAMVFIVFFFMMFFLLLMELLFRFNHNWNFRSWHNNRGLFLYWIYNNDRNFRNYFLREVNWLGYRRLSNLNFWHLNYLPMRWLEFLI